MSTQHFRFIVLNPTRRFRGAAAAKVEVAIGGDWLWMTPADIRANVRDHGAHPELVKALNAYGESL